MTELDKAPLRYYATPGPMTDPGTHVAMFDDLPGSLSDLVAIVQGMLLHMHWAETYGVTLTDERREEAGIRSVDEMVTCLLAMNDSALTKARPFEDRVVGTCRDYAVLLCSMVRHRGVPARARCGFGAYFLPGHYEDHWVCEVWNPDEARWLMVDAQLDERQLEALEITFDPLDVPTDQFIKAGQAWRMCRVGEADPQRFGIFEWHGIWFVRANLVRDFLSLNKIEVLPWDHEWGYLADWEDEGDPLHPTEKMAVDLMDRIASLTLTDDGALDEIKAIYKADHGFHVPAEWHVGRLG